MSTDNDEKRENVSVENSLMKKVKTKMILRGEQK